MNSGRLARNTAALFGRQILVLAINLYAIRFLLSALGIGDFALFNVIVNLVLLGSFLPTALGMVTQRFVSFEIGKCQPHELKSVHDTGLLLWTLALGLVVLGMETAGSWFVAHHLSVAPERLATAQILFQLTILSFTINGFAAFYASIIMAHEDMPVCAVFAVAEALLRFAAVVALGWLEGDLLVLYGLLICLISGAMALAHWLYATRHYPECRFGRIAFNALHLRRMLGFAGWSVFGQLSTVSRNQAVTILINQAFSPATMAARALSLAIGGQVASFSANFSSALHPPIIKAYAAGERDRMFAMVFAGARISFYLVWIATLPLMVIVPGILGLWLGAYPEETALFTRLTLVENAILAISFPLMTAVRATGRLRLYELSLGLVQFAVLLLSWGLIAAGFPAVSVYLVAIAANLAMFALRLLICKVMIGLPVRSFLHHVLAPVLMVVCVSSTLVFGLFWLVPGVERLAWSIPALSTAGLICLLPMGVTYALGLKPSEREALQRHIRQRLSRIWGRI